MDYTGEDLTAAMSDAGMTEAPKMANTEQCVPLSALAMPDADEQMANPEIGDRVNYSVEGTVTRIEGDQAYVQPDMINGQEMEKAPEEAGSSPLAAAATALAVFLLFFCLAFSAMGQTSPYSVGGGSSWSSNGIAALKLPGGSLTVTYVHAGTSDADSSLKLLSLGQGTYSRVKSSLSSVTVTAGGKYEPENVPTVSFSGGTPDFTASGRVRMKALSVEIVNGGTNYAELDVQRVIDEDGGTAVDLEIPPSGVNQNGAITNVTISVAGSLTNPPANNVTTTNHSAGGGSNAVFRITWAVVGVTLDNVGTNYLTRPTVTFTGTSIHSSNAAGLAILQNTNNPVAAGTNTLYLVNPDSYFTAGGLLGVTHTNGVLQLAYVHSVTSSNVVITNGFLGDTTLWHTPQTNVTQFRPVTILASLPWGATTNSVSAPDPGLFVGDGGGAVLGLFSYSNNAAINLVTGKR